jgi:hypothetical protein
VSNLSPGIFYGEQILHLRRPQGDRSTSDKRLSNVACHNKQRPVQDRMPSTFHKAAYAALWMSAPGIFQFANIYGSATVSLKTVP